MLEEMESMEDFRRMEASLHVGSENVLFGKMLSVSHFTIDTHSICVGPVHIIQLFSRSGIFCFDSKYFLNFLDFVQILSKSLS